MNTATAEQIRDVLVALATPDRSPDDLMRGIDLAVAELRQQAARDLAEADRLESKANR